jgi:cell division septation protein DedD
MGCRSAQWFLCAYAVLTTAGVSLAAQQQGRPSTGASGTVSQVMPVSCPTPTGVARAVSPGDVSISTPGGPGHAPDASDLAQHTLFYNNGGAVLSPRDTGGRPARSSTQGGSTSTATVRVRAAGDVAAGAGTTTAGSSKKRTASSRSRVWTVQVASYETLDEAMAMQANLCSRGYEARIRGAVRPFEVRVGRYASSDSALRIARRLTTRQLTVFVTPAE